MQVGAQRVANQGGLLGAVGDVAVAAGSVDNSAGTIGSQTGHLNVNSTGAIANAGGKLIAAQDVSLTGTGLGNQGGTVSARNLSINTGTGGIDNTGGTVSAAGTAAIGAGALVNRGGTLAAVGDVALKVGSLDNTSGTLGSQTAGLKLDSAGDVVNAGGKLVAAQDASIAAASLNSQGGMVSARNLLLDARGGTIDNTKGTVSAAGTATVDAGSLINQGGTLAAVGDVRANVGRLDNTGGALGSQSGGLNVTSAGAIENAGGKLVAAQDATLNAASLGNQAGTISARNLSLNTGTGAIDNTKGTVSAAGTATVDAGSLINRGGTLAAVEDVQANVGRLDNTGGALGSQSASLNVTSTGAIDNAGGKLVAAQDANFRAASLGNQAGTISARNLSLNTGSGLLDNTGGTVSVAGTAAIGAGAVVNRGGTLAAVGDVTLKVSSLDNTSGVLGSQTAGLHLDSTGDVINAGGKLIAAQDATFNAASLNNQGGAVSARGLSIHTGSGTLDNTRGAVSASGAATIQAGNLVNQGGTVAAAGNLNATVASLDNTAGGVLGSSGGNLTVTSASNVANAGGKLLAAQDIALSAASLGNQSGTVAGRNVTVNAGTGALDNTGGAIAAAAGLDATAGAVTNANGVLQAGTTLTAHSQSLTNTSGALIGNAVSVNSGTLANRQGTISSATTLDVQGQSLNNAQGKLVSNGTLTIHDDTVTNAGGQIASNADVTVSGTTLDNSAGLMHAGGTLSVNGASVVNKNTNSAGTGMEGANVALTATTSFDNTAGAVRSDQSTQITAPAIDNTQGAIQSAGTVGAKAAGALTNTRGNLVGTRSVAVTAGRMSGDGTVQSQGSVSLNLQSDFVNTGTVAAGQDVSVTTTGNVTNAGTLSAGRNLAVSANNIANTQSGQLIGAVSNTLTARGTLSNDGLIDGGATVVRANTVVNTGRLYGDTVAIQANTLTNTVNASGVAGVIASRGDMDLGVQTLNNQEHALIYTAGNLRVGGALDAGNHATGSAQSVTNGSATINADANLTIAAAQINNENNHFSVINQTSAGSHITFYRLDGSLQNIDPSTVWLFHQNTGEWHTGADWPWLGDDDYKVMVMPSAQYPFERYGPPFDYSKEASKVAMIGAPLSFPIGAAYSPGGVCSGDNCTVSEYPEHFVYSASDRIWDVFGIARPQEIGPQPIQENYIGRAAQYATDYAAWEQRHDAALPHYQQLNNAIAAFNRDFSHRQVDHFTIYDGTQQVTRTVVTQSDPGTITSGGSMTLNAGVVNNVASQIVAGGDLTGNNVIGTRPNNVGMQGTQTVTTTGQAIYTHVDDRDRVNDARPWQGQTEQTQFQLDVSATSGTGPHSQPTVKSVAATATAGQGNGSATAVADHMTIAGGAASIAVPTGGTVHAVTSTVAAPAGSTVSAGTAAVTVPNSSAVIRTVTPNLTLPNNALYRIVRDPGSRVLVETDPRFTNFRQWSSSDVMLSQFRNDPGATLKRIGDGFYEQQLIQQQIIRATGQRFIGDYTSNEDEYKALLAAGVAAGKAFGLNVGTALTDEQMARLTTDIVWMVRQTVTLADGTKQEVLVPQVYLRAKDTDLTGGGTLMAGNNVSFQAKGDVTNSGTIASRRVTVVTGDNIVNTGTLAGKTLLAQAAQDINNLGGHIQGDQVLLSAGRDVNLTSTSTSTANATTLGTNISQVASVDAGTLGIQAGRDVNLTAAAITTSGSAGVAANRDVNLSAVRQSSEEHVVWGDKNRSDRSAYADVGTQIQTGGNLAIGAGQDVSATAAYANATGSIQVAAGRDVNLNAGQSHQDVRDEHFQTEKGFLSSKTTHTIDSVGQTNAVGTTLSGDKVNVAAGRDLNVRGSNVAATQDVSLQAKNDVNIESTTSSTSEAHYRKETQSGLMGSGGIGFTIGNRLQSEDDRTTHTLAAASTVGSTGGNVSITAGNQYRQVGSNVIATQGDVDILAKKVDIQEAREQGRSSQESKFEQSGLTVAVTAPVIAAMQTASQMGSAASETSDTRLKMLAGGATALAGKNAADAIAADPKSGGGASISITVGGSKSESKQTQDADTAAGSTVRAGGDVRIRATGDGQNSTLTVQGSDVQAGKNALLKADGDINLLAAKNTADMERSSSSMSGGVGVAVSVSSNGASFGVTANASASRGTGNGHDVTWTNTHVNAGNQLTLESGGDTNLKGAVASGRQVVADVGGNLNATSLQDTSTFHSKDQSISGSVTVGYGFSGSASISQQKIDSDYASVTEQSGIKAGDGGFQINVRGNTDLKGAVITSTDKAVQNGANSLTTATLTTSDIQNHADYNASSIGIGGGYSSGGSGVGKNQKGEATTGGDKVPGSTLPSAGGFSATPPVVMGASGSGSSTTVSGVSGGAIHITNGAKQQALTGKDADQTVAGLNRNVSSEVDTTGALKPIFNEKEIRTGFEITGTFISQAGTFLNNRAQESTAAQKALDAEKAKPADQQDAAKIAQLTQTLQDNATWGMGGTGRMLLTALTAGAGANVTGGMGQLAQNATVAYLQALGANQVKQIADGLGSEDARAALHAIVGCAGAAAGSQSCGAGAMGAATSSVIGSLLSPTDGMTPDQRQARENLVTSLVAGIAGATGVNAATATSAGQIEVENNQVWGPAPRPSPPPPSPGQPRKPFETPGFKGETAKKGDGVISDPVQQLDPTANIHANPVDAQTGPKILVSPIDIVKSAIEHIIASVNNRMPIPEKVTADNGLQVESNPKHTPGMSGNRPSAGTEPRNSLDLFNSSVAGKEGTRYAIDGDGNINRFSANGNGVYHWSGSTGDEKNPLDTSSIPVKVKRDLGFRGK
ncbi:hemagglutinin repeat-containing protein [Ralstonia nicotianae]